MEFPFIIAMNLIAWAAYYAGWSGGGHPERFAVAVLLMHALIEVLFREWHVNGIDVGIAAGQFLLLLVFGWLALISDRWWPLAAVAILILIMLVHALTMATPLSYFSATSARVGLWTMLHLTVLAGVGGRWLAGEARVSRLGRRAPSGRTPG